MAGKPDPKKRYVRRPKPARAIEADIWREGLGRCHVQTLWGGCEGRVDGHHIVYAQQLRKHGLHEYLLDKRNRLPLCRFHHEQHHSRYRPVPIGTLPMAAVIFAAETGFTDWLKRNYPEEAHEAEAHVGLDVRLAS